MRLSYVPLAALLPRSSHHPSSGHKPLSSFSVAMHNPFPLTIIPNLYCPPPLHFCALLPHRFPTFIILHPHPATPSRGGCPSPSLLLFSPPFSLSSLYINLSSPCGLQLTSSPALSPALPVKLSPPRLSGLLWQTYPPPPPFGRHSSYSLFGAAHRR